MSGKRKEWEDDGRTVADMSGLDRPTLFGHKEGGSRKKQQESEQSGGEYVPPLSRGDRWAFLLGTMKASLLIALAFLGGLGLCMAVDAASALNHTVRKGVLLPAAHPFSIPYAAAALRESSHP